MNLGRQAHEHQSKVGQSWRSIVEKEYDEYGYLVKVDIKGPVKCTVCESVIRYDQRGYAVCSCGLTWNELADVKWNKKAEEITRFQNLKRLKKECKFNAPGV